MKVIIWITDYGLMKPFFIEIPNFWAWADNLGILDMFGHFISTHFGTVTPLSIFSTNQPSILQKNLAISYLNLNRKELGI